jgi:peptidoglycan L-alanyl-D-glutamate endopeptidase CwlK
MGLHHTADVLCPLCENKLTQAHPDLVSWFRTVKSAHPDVHVSWSYRDQESQEAAFEDGKTKLHYPHSAHNELPSSALDLFEIKNGDAVWDSAFFAALNSSNKDGFPHILWGGRWKTLGDNDHFELVDKEAANPKE